jgi:hypothetical protein
MVDITAEKAGWSGAPQAMEAAVQQKVLCDELVAQVQAGYLEESYPYVLGKLEGAWRFIYAVGKDSKQDEAIKETMDDCVKLRGLVEKHYSMMVSPERLPVLENQRLREMFALKMQIIGLICVFWQEVLILGVKAGIYSYQKGGEWQPSKSDRGMGVPVLRGGINIK